MGVMDDDLDAPLGQFPVRKRPPLGHLSPIGLVLGGLGLFGALAAGLPLFSKLALSNSHTALLLAVPGTEPSETAPPKAHALPRRAGPPQTGAAISGEATTPPSGLSVASPLVAKTKVRNSLAIGQTAGTGVEAIEQQSGVRIIRPGGSAAPGALIIDVAKALNATPATAPDPQLIEETPYGPVPRIGTDGGRPAEVYARAAVSLPGLPRIALLVGGMGLSPGATEAAIAALPSAVTLGFAPYGTGLAKQTALAREAGHEVVLELPMEPFDFPRSNPGPHTLVTGAGKVANSANLTWLMSRFTGYAGVANFLGGKFLADAKALAPVLRAIAERGLFYLDDGTSARSLAMTLAPDSALEAARADIVLDSTASPDAIEAALARLEAIARDKGLAIGVASALPVSVETIGRFARALDSHGIALVPLSAAMPRLQQDVTDHQP